MLARRYSYAVPRNQAFARTSARETEPTLCIQEARGPGMFQVFRRVGHDPTCVVSGVRCRRAPRSTRFIPPALVLLANRPQRRGRLFSFHWSQITPQKCNDGLRLFEHAGAPRVRVIRIRRLNTTHPENRAVETEEDGRRTGVPGLRHAH